MAKVVTMTTTKGKITGRTTPTRQFKLKSGVAMAKERIGKLLPVSLGSKDKSRIVSCTPNASGVSCWYLLECGVRVCVEYKNWRPIMWCGVPKNGIQS